MSGDEMPGSFAECWSEIAALRARVAQLEAALQGVVDGANERIGYYGYPQCVVEDDAMTQARAALRLSGNKEGVRE